MGVGIRKVKRLANVGLDKVAFDWQEQKDKKDGFFLSCGLNPNEAYDNYDFLYTINIGSLAHRPWNTVNFPHAELEVRQSHLYMDSPNIESATMIAIVCLRGGAGRSYELLIMTPCSPAICEVEFPKGSGQYISFAEWKRKLRWYRFQGHLNLLF